MVFISRIPMSSLVDGRMCLILPEDEYAGVLINP